MVQNEIKNYFINFLNRKGKKSKIEKIYNQLLLDLKKNNNNNPKNIFDNSINNLRPKIEIKQVSRFKSIIVPLKKKKQINISLNWLTDSYIKSKNNKNKVLINEIISTFNKESSSYQKKISLYKESQKFKFNIKK